MIDSMLRDRLRLAEENGEAPRVHGNGFLQIDVGKGNCGSSFRIHVWGHPDLPKQKVDTSIHNHRFNFSSTCLVGRLFNLVYRPIIVSRDATHQAYYPQVRDGEDTVLNPVGPETYFQMINPAVQVIPEGERYDMPGSFYHETTTDRPSATLMQKLNHDHCPAIPWVMVPRGFEPDNEFNRNIVLSKERAWEITHEVLNYA